MTSVSSTESVLIDQSGGVLTLTLNRPEKINALTQEMYLSLCAGLDQASESDDIAAVLIAANGDNFSAGNDVKDFVTVASAAGPVNPDDIPAVAFIYRLVNFEKPLFVAVQGQAVGIGLTLMLHADFVYLADNAILSAPFVDLGLVPEAGSSLILPQRIGTARASAVLLAGKPVDAATALDWGLANHVVASNALRETAMKMAHGLAAKPKEAVRLSKQLMSSDRAALNAHIDTEFALFFERLRSDEAKAAFAAFLAKSS